MEWIKTNEKLPEEGIEVYLLVYKQINNIYAYPNSSEEEWKNFNIFGSIKPEENEYELEIQTGVKLSDDVRALCRKQAFQEENNEKIKFWDRPIFRWGDYIEDTFVSCNTTKNKPETELIEGDYGAIVIAWMPIERPTIPDIDEFLKV